MMAAWICDSPRCLEKVNERYYPKWCFDSDLGWWKVNNHLKRHPRMQVINTSNKKNMLGTKMLQSGGPLLVINGVMGPLYKWPY